MRLKKMQTYISVGFILFLVLALNTVSFAQGRGRGGGVGGGRGSGGGMGSMGNPNSGRRDSIGVDRGLERSSSASNGRADAGRRTAADKSNGRSEEGLNRARMVSENLTRADKELREHPGITSTLHVTANDLRSQYRAALMNDPDLKFGQFVAATRLAQNLGRRHPAITRNAILAGLESGKSLGRTLQDLGLSDHEAKEAKKQADREIRHARDQ